MTLLVYCKVNCLCLPIFLSGLRFDSIKMFLKEIPFSTFEGITNVYLL